MRRTDSLSPVTAVAIFCPLCPNRHSSVENIGVGLVTTMCCFRSLYTSAIYMPRPTRQATPSTDTTPRMNDRKFLVCSVPPCLRGRFQFPLYAVPIFTPRNLAGAAPWPVPMVCMGWPLPQLGVPHSIHWSREQMASMEFQNSVVIPEYDGFLNMRPSLPPLISQPISQPNWKL